MDEEHDRLDDSIRVWAREVPELNALTEGIVERMQFLAKAFDRSLDETLTQYGLDRHSYYLLAWLRKHGAPYRGSPGELATDMRLSSGAMTNRLDRVEAAGLIRRLPNPNDRRGTIIEPTEAGNAAWDSATGTAARREATIASVLEPAEREELHLLLRRLMRAFPDKDQHV